VHYACAALRSLAFHALHYIASHRIQGKDTNNE
jgi:hypothetical protein